MFNTNAQGYVVCIEIKPNLSYAMHYCHITGKNHMLKFQMQQLKNLKQSYLPFFS